MTCTTMLIEKESGLNNLSYKIEEFLCNNGIVVGALFMLAAVVVAARYGVI